MMTAIPNKLYRHKKTGGLYIVQHVGMHTETEETLVSYTSVQTGMCFMRPFDMFCDGRFEEVKDAGQ